jgi:alpha-ketoglutarate-dependent taurine dioxygenase
VALEAEAPGGDTLLVDGFAAAELLRQQDPAAFELLRTVPMTSKASAAMSRIWRKVASAFSALPSFFH